MTALSIFLRISLLFLPRQSAARGSLARRITTSFPFKSFSVTSSYKRISGKDSSGSPSASTKRTCFLSCVATKVSISFLHHCDKGSLGVQITIRNSALLSAAMMGSERLSDKGSSASSRKTLSIFFFFKPIFFRTDFGSLKFSSFL